MEARLAKLRGIDPAAPKNTIGSVTIQKVVIPQVVQEQNLIKQISEEITIEKMLPNPDDEIAERLAKLKGVDVNQIKHPGAGLEKPRPKSVEKTVAVDPEKFLMDHGAYAKSAKEGDDLNREPIIPKLLKSSDDGKGLKKDVAAITKEVSSCYFSGIHSGLNGHCFDPFNLLKLCDEKSENKCLKQIKIEYLSQF